MWNKSKIIVLLLTVFAISCIRRTEQQEEDVDDEVFSGESYEQEEEADYEESSGETNEQEDAYEYEEYGSESNEGHGTNNGQNSHSRGGHRGNSERQGTDTRSDRDDSRGLGTTARIEEGGNNDNDRTSTANMVPENNENRDSIIPPKVATTGKLFRFIRM